MDPKEMQLPEPVTVLGPELARIWKILWAVDPPTLKRLKDETVINIAKIGIDYRIKAARLEAQMKELEAESLAAVSKELGARG